MKWHNPVFFLMLTLGFTVAPAAILACGTERPVAPERPGLPATAQIGAAPTAAATPVPQPDVLMESLRSVPGIVDPSNLGWPREIRTDQGTIKIEAPPQRIHTLSLGHDEIVIGLVGAKRIAGIGSFTADPVYSNVAEDVKDLPKVRRDAEQVLGLKPDLVIASKFTSKDLIDRIRGAGVIVVQTSLESSALGNIPNMMLLGYVLGAERQALNLSQEIEARLRFVSEKVGASVPANAKVRALSIARFAESIDAAGAGSTEGGIVEAAGGVNVAAESGLTDHKQVSIESIASMSPEIIILTQPGDAAGVKFREELLAAPALANVPAVKNNRIVFGDSRYYTTLSHWNVRGIEESARLFYPDVFAGTEFNPFRPAGEPG